MGTLRPQSQTQQPDEAKDAATAWEVATCSIRKCKSMAGIDIKPDAQGKVRDLYDLGDKLLLEKESE